MKATIDGIEVEGSPAEIARFVTELRFSGKRATNTDKLIAPAGSADHLGDADQMSDAVAWRIIQRKPLSDAQKAVLKRLLQNHPKETSFDELQQATGYSKAQLSGALGAFGRRVTSTHGYATGTTFLEWEWDHDTGRYNYRLSDAAAGAVRRAAL